MSGLFKLSKNTRKKSRRFRCSTGHIPLTCSNMEIFFRHLFVGNRHILFHAKANLFFSLFLCLLSDYATLAPAKVGYAFYLPVWFFHDSTTKFMLKVDYQMASNFATASSFIEEHLEKSKQKFSIAKFFASKNFVEINKWNRNFHINGDQ